MHKNNDNDKIRNLIKDYDLLVKVKPLRGNSRKQRYYHYSIIDNEGNAVSNTYTLGYSFGSGVTIPGTGILMNNQMNNFAFQYGDQTEISRSSSPGNRFIPGKRPMSTMNPVIVKIRMAIFQSLLGHPEALSFLQLL